MTGLVEEEKSLWYLNWLENYLFGGAGGEMESGDFDELFINKPISFSSEIVQQFNCWRKCILESGEQLLSGHRLN